MQVVLLKDYKPHSRELKAGVEMGVTNAEGLKLIEKGIAKDVTKEYKKDILVKREIESNKVKDEVEALKPIEKEKAKPKNKQKK